MIGDMREVAQISFNNGGGAVQEFHYHVTCDYEPAWIGPESISLPGGYGLTNAYPNPFNSIVNVHYILLKGQIVSLKVYDMSGKMVDVLSEGLQGSGTAVWNADGMQSGVYMMKLTVGDQVSMKKVVLMR